MMVAQRSRRAFRVAFLALGATLVLASAGLTQSDRSAALFGRFDTNGDGRISRDEFELKKVEIVFSAASSRGATLRFEETRISRGAFDALDLDHDGVLTAGEVMAAPIFEFDTWDTDHDGVITREEFAAQLRRIDR